MKKRNLYFIKLICFIILAGCLICFLNKLFVPKYYYETKSATSLTSKGFYDLEKDSVDVIIVGTSQGASSISPFEMYDREKIHAYNLCNSAQPVFFSLAWIKEACKYQKIDTVIYDVNYVFATYNNDGVKRQNIDGMRMGKAKLEGVLSSIKEDESKFKSLLGYFSFLYRYHDRWTELAKEDYRYLLETPKSYLKGFWMLDNNFSISDFSPLTGQEELVETNRITAAEEYFVEIINYCKDNNINLILYKAPDHNFTIFQHNVIEEYAKEYGLEFYDMNMVEYYEKAGLDYQTDMDEANGKIAHTNVLGGKKISDFFADILSKRTTLIRSEDASYEVCRGFNEMIYEDFYLHNQYNYNVYSSMLNKPWYTVIKSNRGDADYINVSEAGNVLCEMKDSDDNEINLSIDNGRTQLFVKSDDKNTSILIDGKEEAVNEDGLNIVVYNNIRHCVIDSIAFDIDNPDNPGIR